ncbi:ATP-dependent zinc metalloprotease FtsH 3 (plasmid) [Methylobacterium bullatum]|uniref:ATP-dependent zinc metalloprotease FtsH 3 n=2 Tax=Methylobacterium bullatum TaxID=570505 RepID=A0A679K7Y2_9HYPH|nr:ATP-dependent zinc metalloprotease FtsH 3 [Methylobacterium bullatum]
MAKKTPFNLKSAKVEGERSLDEMLNETPEFEFDALRNVSMSSILARLVLEDALSTRDCARLRGFKGVAIVVGVPSADWVEPIKNALRGFGTFPHMVARNGASRLQDRPEVGNEDVARHLGSNHNVGGISQAPERYLPSALIAGADIRIEITTPTNQTISQVILRVTGRRPRRLPPRVASGLGFHDLCAAIRTESSPGECVRRLTAMTRSRSMADPDLGDVPHVRDLHGYQGAQEWAVKLIDDVQAWREGRLQWSQIDRAVVIASDPGLGKTTFARSVAKSLGMNFVPTSIAHWFSSTDGYLNEIVKFVDKLLAQAAANGPAVLLLDELDGLPRRATLGSRNKDYWTPIIGHILLALDSAVSGDAGKLVIIGATNHAASLDEALIRPGRLNRVIHLARPDAAAVAGILRQHLNEDLRGFDLSGLATLGAGSTGAEIAGWVKAARRTARIAERPMIAADLMAEIVPPDGRPPGEILATARHEAAHAVLSEILQVSEVSYLSIIASKSMAGSMRARLLCSASPTRAELDAYVVTVLSGRAADEMWGGVSAGAGGHPSSDLGIATRTVASCHASLGLGGTLVMRATDEEALTLVKTDAAFRAIVESDLAKLYLEAQTLVAAHASLIDRVAHVLARQRIIDGPTLRMLIADAAPGDACSVSPILLTGGNHG